MLEGAVQRGTGKGLRNLNLDIAGKTGTTNKNNDTWFIGFTSKLVIGVYIGMDEPESLGRYETGAKTAMPVFKDFVKKAIKKKDAKPFKVAPNIIMIVVEPITGKKASFGSKETIIEVFKKEEINNEINSFGNIKDRLKKNNILKFY
jgi:penicillin-binding protein 1A